MDSDRIFSSLYVWRTGEGGNCEGFPVPGLLIKATQLSSAVSLPEMEFLNIGEKVSLPKTHLSEKPAFHQCSWTMAEKVLSIMPILGPEAETTLHYCWRAISSFTGLNGIYLHMQLTDWLFTEVALLLLVWPKSFRQIQFWPSICNRIVSYFASSGMLMLSCT